MLNAAQVWPDGKLRSINLGQSGNVCIHGASLKNLSGRGALTLLLITWVSNAGMTLHKNAAVIYHQLRNALKPTSSNKSMVLKMPSAVLVI